MNSRKAEIEHEKQVIGVAKLIDELGKVMLDAGHPPRKIALQAQVTCNQYGVTLEEAANANTISWTVNYPSAMDELQKQDPRLYTYCLQNNYEVQKTRQGLFVTGGPDPNDPLDFMSLDLFRAITYAVWEGRESSLDGPVLLRELGKNPFDEK